MILWFKKLMYHLKTRYTKSDVKCNTYPLATEKLIICFKAQAEPNIIDGKEATGVRNLHI
jgi:hypothetical protein